MDDTLFEKTAKDLLGALRVAMSVGRLAAYNAFIGDVEVIVVGYPQDPTDLRASIKPLAVLMTDDLFRLVTVEGTRIGPDGEEIRDAADRT